MTRFAAIEQARQALNRICADSLDIPLVYPDGRTALDVQTAEMGEVSAWFVEARDALVLLQEAMEAAEQLYEAATVPWLDEDIQHDSSYAQQGGYLRADMLARVAAALRRVRAGAGDAA